MPGGRISVVQGQSDRAELTWHGDTASEAEGRGDEIALQTSNPVSPETSAKKLIDKLFNSGQLRASFLIRVLHQGQMDLFDHGFAALLQVDVDTVRKALYENSPNEVALACRAAGIDRSAFLTVFNLSRAHKRVTTALSDSDQREILAVFSQFQKTDALQRLKAVAA